MSETQKIDLTYLHGDDGRAFYTKGHVSIDDFISAVRKEVDANDEILRQEVCHCWMRVCRDFSQEHKILVEAIPNSRGAFKCTWLQDE